MNKNIKVHITQIVYLNERAVNRLTKTHGITAVCVYWTRSEWKRQRNPLTTRTIIESIKIIYKAIYLLLVSIRNSHIRCSKKKIGGITHRKIESYRELKEGAEKSEKKIRVAPTVWCDFEPAFAGWPAGLTAAFTHSATQSRYGIMLLSAEIFINGKKLLKWISVRCVLPTYFRSY